MVVVGIIGLLIALVTPAVQAAREAARRGQCVSNLRQIGIALQSYESAHGMFPPDRIMNPHGWSAHNYSGLSYILPYIEQSPLYHSINFDYGYEESASWPSLENHTARNTGISIYLCPSDGGHRHLNSYRLNRGRWGIVRPYQWDGVFCFGVLPRPATITDGLSRTAFVSERLGGSFVRGSADHRRGFKVPDIHEYPAWYSDAQFIPLCQSLPVWYWDVISGRYWLYYGTLQTDYNHGGLPNDTRPSCSISAAGYGMNPPRSYHPGGVNVLLGDGHVEFIQDSIEPNVWVALGTRAAGDS